MYSNATQQFSKIIPQFPIKCSCVVTNTVSSNPAHDEVNSIQHYVIQFASGWRQVVASLVSSTNETYRHYIAEIFLKVALNTKANHNFVAQCNALLDARV